MALHEVITIASSEAIGQVIRKGRRQNGALLSIQYLPASSGRVAFIASKRLGGAVWRNRAKRVLRAALVQAGGSRAGHDLLLIANTRTAESSSNEVAQELATLFDKARI